MEKIFEVFNGALDFVFASDLSATVKGYIAKLVNVIYAAFGWGAAEA